MYIQYNFKKIVIGYIIGIFIFILSAFLIIMYSLGYRFNYQNYNIEKTGIVRLDPINKNYQVSIDGEPVNDKYISKTTQIDNLQPDYYTIEIIAENFQKWQKNIKILPNQITNIYDIFLMPEHTKTSEISYFDQYTTNEKYQLVAFATTDKLQILNFISEKIQTPNNIKINASSKIDWINEELLAITNSNPEETYIQILNPFNNNISSTTIPFSINATDIIGTLPLQESTIIFYFDNDLYTTNLTTNTPPQILVENIYSPIIFNGNLYYLPNPDNSSEIIIQNLTLKNTSNFTLPIVSSSFQNIPNSDFIVTKNSTQNYIINISNSTSYPLSNVNQTILSPDGKNLVSINNQEIIVSDIERQFFTNTILRLSTHLNNIILLDSRNIIYSSTNQISRIEIDGDNHNIIEENDNANYNVIFANKNKILAIQSIENQYLLKYINLTI